jgi:hypothetical protein
MSCAVIPAASVFEVAIMQSTKVHTQLSLVCQFWPALACPRLALARPRLALALPSLVLACHRLGHVCSKAHTRKRTQVMILDESNYEKFSANPKDETVRGCQEERVLNTETTCFSLQTKKCRTHPEATHPNKHVNYTHVVIRCGEHSPGSCLLRLAHASSDPSKLH